MKTKLAINLGFAVNRFTPPEDWIPFVKNELGVDCVQLTADMFQPYIMDPLALRIAARTRVLADKHRVTIGSTFTGAFTRLNHFSHPDTEVRKYWQRWFQAFAEISATLGSTNLGSHLGIQTVRDCRDPVTRQQTLEITLENWYKLAVFAKSLGLAYLAWEPMSIPREYGETLAETERIREMTVGFPLPMLLCLDVDHGDVESQDPDDTNPYVWLERFARITPLVHLKQSHTDKGGHWPFTPEHNTRGKIVPEKVITALENGGAQEVLLILEFSFRERSPAEKRMVSDLKLSVDFWKSFCNS